MTAIYCILNKLNGHKYIGSAINFYKRKNQHIRKLNKKEHHSQYLQNAWNIYGEKCFVFLVLEKVDDKNKLIEREQWWIDNSNSDYNVCKIAGSSLGIKRSEETKEKCRKSHLGEVHPQWRKDLKSISQGGRNHYNYGKKLSKETISKKSESMKKFYLNNPHPNTGVKYSKERIEKMSKVSSKPIFQYDLNWNFITEWSSIKEASKSLDITESTIILFLKGKTLNPQKFKWRYKTKD